MRSWRTFVILMCVYLLAGCTSTPQHTNTLVFGTTTRLALDVSQDPTASVGVTLGYKRQEAVWMPLLPNQPVSNPQAQDSKLQPITCGNRTRTEYDVPKSVQETECEMFIGTDKDRNRDTYSVLASFGANAGGSAQSGSVNGNGQIAQYFATGLAARLLAQSGGAGLVNTSGPSPQATVQAELAKSRLEQLLGKLSKDGISVDAAQVTAAFAKAPGSSVDATVQGRVKAATTVDALRFELTSLPTRFLVEPMLTTLQTQ